MTPAGKLWAAFYGGRIVLPGWRRRWCGPADVSEGSKRCGLGFWPAESDSAALLLGVDAGVSFQTVHDPEGPFTSTVISNTSGGAWPVAQHEEVRLGSGD